MLALRTSPPIFTAADALRIAREHYGLSGEIRALPGERDANFRLTSADRGDFVLKVVDPGISAEVTDCQVRVLRHLAEQDPALPVQRIFPTLEGAPVGTVLANGVAYPLCLVGYLPGKLFSELKPTVPLLQNLGLMLARLDHALQGFFHPALAPHLAWDVRRLPELSDFSSYIESQPLRYAVEAAAAALKERRVLLNGLPAQAIHGDCHGHNLLVDADERAISGILDFGDMLHAPRVLEPAVAMSELLTDDLASLDAVREVLRGYVRGQPLERDEVEAIYDLIVARHAITILLHVWRKRNDPPGARVLDRSALHAARSLEALAQRGREVLTRRWHEAAGTSACPGAAAPLERAAARTEEDAAETLLMRRRHRLMGAAELFYEQPLHLVRGSGVWLYDAEGRAYLDVYNNVPHVGHTHPTVVVAIQKQTALLVTHTRYLHAGILDYAERLTATLPKHLDTCIFVNSGSEANDVAWRIARFATGHEGGVVMEHAYHGITDAVAALTPGMGRPRDPRVVTLAVPPAPVRAGDTPSAGAIERAALDAEQAIGMLAARGFAPAAFYIDSALTSSGIIDPPPAWAAAVTGRVRAAGGLIVADEVQYGLGRSGSHFWGFARRGIEPDIVTMGKPVGNGYPMGVVVAGRALIEAFQERYGFFSTFGGTAVAAAAGLAVLDVLDREQLMGNAASVGEYLERRLTALGAAHDSLGAVRGSGLLLGLEVVGSEAQAARVRVKQIVNTLASRARVLIGSEGPEGDVLKLRPPMPFLIEHAELLVAAIEAAAADLDSNRRQRPAS